MPTPPKNTVHDTFNDLRTNSKSESEKGRRFEELFCRVAPLVPELEIAEGKIWRWADWPRLAELGDDGRDDGVDIVAELTSGATVAIQCKCYAEERKIGKDELKDFIAAAAPKVFQLRWFVATCDYNDIAQKLINRNEIRVIDFREYLGIELTKKVKPPREPWPLQQEAIDNVIQGFAESDRGKLIMACGTGKTFTSLKIAERLAPDNAKILFVAPSIALVAQARREWLTHTRRRLVCTVICSDSTAGRSTEDSNTTEISCEVTTDPEKIAAALNQQPDATHAVFCTYQSLAKLKEAQQKHDAPDFDFALIDEAHRTTGYLDEDRAGLFQLIHSQENIRANHRLYMTATPRVYDIRENKKGEQPNVVDMNDVQIYGREFHRLTFKDAVEAGMLCDYRVIALGIAEDTMSQNLIQRFVDLNDDIGGVGKAADEQAFLSLGAIALTINDVVKGENTPGILARTIAYASNIRRSKWLAKALTDSQMKSWVTRAGKKHGDSEHAPALAINTKHLDGTSSALQRNDALRKLNDAASVSEPHLITNAKLFTEGVDVPALNAIAFLDPRQSKVDTIQAVGRVMRKDTDSGKKFGYIIVPVILPPGMELMEVLTEEKSRFKSLGVVLRALQSHDERLYTELTDRLTFATANRDPNYDSLPKEDYAPVQTSLLDENAKQEIFAQIATNTGISQQGGIIADAITIAVGKAARYFTEAGVVKIIADTIGTPSDNDEESCKTAALLIVNACIMHKRLEQTGNLGGLSKIEFANLTSNPASALEGAWLTILEKDYAPVFQDATALLHALPHNKLIHNAIDTLIQCAIDNATTLNELGFDHAGPLYHRILGSAQSDGAYYTKNLSGYLLAGLALDENFIDWKDAEKIAKLKIIDPACGTGTLLMAALNIIKKRAAKAQDLDEDGINKLHKRLVEVGIYGLDINKYSIQLAACNLTIGAPNTNYDRMNLHTLEHGPVAGKTGDRVADVRHGALEKLLDNNMSNCILEPPLLGKDTSRKMAEVLLPSEFDVVIYNPPFTDTQKQSDKYSEQATNSMRERLQYIKSELAANDLLAAKAIGKQSIGPFFTPLTNELLPTDKGTIAKIIPATFCTSENGRSERQYIADNFHVETVITSHDPKHINFSENTTIHECLLITRRSANKKKPTRFIQITKYPHDIESAEVLIDKINSGDGGDLYTETLWDSSKICDGDWSPVQWFNPKLAHAANEINTMKNLNTADEICSVGYVCQQFRSDFDYTPNNLWGGGGGGVIPFAQSQKG